MTTRADYAPDDWETLRLAPSMAAEAVRLAGPSGPGGRFLEERAEKHATQAALAQLGSVELIADLAGARIDEAPAPVDSDAAAAREAYIAAALEEAKRAGAILAAASSDEREAYASLVMDVAEAVAKAAGEPGSDANLTDGERVFLVHLAAAMGVDGYKPPHRMDSPFGDYRDTGAAERELYGEDPTR